MNDLGMAVVETGTPSEKIVSVRGELRPLVGIPVNDVRAVSDAVSGIVGSDLAGNDLAGDLDPISRANRLEVREDQTEINQGNSDPQEHQTEEGNHPPRGVRPP